MQVSDNLARTQPTLVDTVVWKDGAVTNQLWKTYSYSRHTYNRTGYRFKPYSSGVDLSTGLRLNLPVSDSHTTIWPKSSTRAGAWTNGYGRPNSVSNMLMGASYNVGSVPAGLAMPGSALITPAILGELSDNVILDATGHIQPAASLLVDLAEIGQVIAMVTSAKGLIKDGPRILRQRLKSPTNGKGIIGVIKELAGLDLAYKFGIGPLISTAQSLYNWEDAVQDRIYQLCERTQHTKEGKFFPLSSRRTLRAESTSSYTTSVAWKVGSYQRVETGCVRAYAKAEYNMNASAYWALTKDYFALNSFANMAWNLIPFSFVADWFINVGNLAEAIENRLGVSAYPEGNMQSPIGRAHIVLPSNSVKRDCFSTVGYKSPAVSYSILPPNSTFEWNMRHRSYDRKIGLVRDLPLSLATSGWNSWRTGTGAELIVQIGKFR